VIRCECGRVAGIRRLAARRHSPCRRRSGTMNGADTGAAGMPAIDDSENERRLSVLDRIWGNGPGLVGQLTAVNHSLVGIRFIVTGFAFLLVGGMLAMFIRLQLAWFDSEVLDPARYNQFVTMHGTTMMFLFAVPIME